MVRVQVLLDSILIDGSPFSVFVQKSLPPKVVQFAFDVGGSTIICRFASDTNMAYQGKNTSIPCSRIFDDYSISLLTRDSVCSFTSGSSLTIHLPVYNQTSRTPSVSIGDTLYFNDNIIYNSAYTSLAVQGAVIVAPPVQGGFPQIVLDVPRSIGACADIPVDASQTTGGSSRPLLFAWKIQAAPGGQPISLQLSAYVLAQSGPDFTIPNRLLPSGSTIVIFLSVANMFERLANANVSVFISSLSLPSVAIEGLTSMSAKPQAFVQIKGRANSTCSGSAAVKFSWSVVRQSLQGALPSLTGNMRSIQFVPADQGMLMGVSYTLEVKATIS